MIPFAAGGFADITMRVLAEKLGERLNQRVFIENRPGGGGVVAAQAVTSSPADGYTLFVLAVGTAMSVALFKSLPFDASQGLRADLDGRAVRHAAADESVLADPHAWRSPSGRRASAARSMNLATTLPGSSPQFMAGALFRSVAKVKSTQVPFRTSPDVLLAVMRGDVDVAIESYGALRSAIDGGQVRPIVSTGTHRSLPNVPTSRESGMPQFEMLGWNALFAPAGTPPEVIACLNKEIMSDCRIARYAQAHRRARRHSARKFDGGTGGSVANRHSEVARYRRSGGDREKRASRTPA